MHLQESSPVDGGGALLVVLQVQVDLQEDLQVQVELQVELQQLQQRHWSLQRLQFPSGCSNMLDPGINSSSPGPGLDSGLGLPLRPRRCSNSVSDVEATAAAGVRLWP